jgi:Fe-Mn family superoxide dismutase
MFTLPALSYSYDALEPHIDAKTMELHHSKHHQTYVDKLNAAVQGTEWAEMDVIKLLQNFENIPTEKQTAVRNHGSGHANHSLWWEILTPGGSKQPAGELATAIDSTFASIPALTEAVTAAAVNQFGSGWGWLVVTADKKLEVLATPNQDSPYMTGKTPILGIDVWEHAYYLKYQNRRPDYVTAFWNVVNWDIVGEKYTQAMR